MAAKKEKKESVKQGISSKKGKTAKLDRGESDYARRREYLIQWAKESTMSVHLHFNVRNDIDIVEWMKDRRNKQGYIKSLIRADMARCSEENITPEEREDRDNTASE